MCCIPPNVTRSTASRGKSSTYLNAQHSAMMNAHAEINASAQKSCYTTIATDSSQTAHRSSVALKDAPENEADESDDPSITPQINPFSSTISLISTASISNVNMSMRGWSGVRSPTE